MGEGYEVRVRVRARAKSRARVVVVGRARDVTVVRAAAVIGQGSEPPAHCRGCG